MAANHNLSDDAVVVLAMTTLNNATTVHEYLLQLTDIGRTLVSVCARGPDTTLHGGDA